MYLGKRKKKELHGDFYHGGERVAPSTWFHREPWYGSARAALHYGMAYIASACSFRGGDEGGATFSYSGSGNPYDTYIRTISGPKWIALQSWWESPRKCNSALDFIDADFEPNEVIRVFCRQFVPERYHVYYDGSYVNVAITSTGFAKMVHKLEGIRDTKGNVSVNIPMGVEKLFKAWILLLHQLKFEEIDLPYDCSEKVAHHDWYKHIAALGFDSYQVRRCGNKGMWIKENQKFIDWFLWKLIREGAKVEDIAPCAAYVLALKAEVRGPDVPIDKVRLLMTNEMFIDFLKDTVMRPNYLWYKGLDDYLGGVPLRGGFIPKLLRAIGHPLARIWFPKCEVLPYESAIVCLDLSSQDNSYKNEGKHLKIMTFLLAFRFENSQAFGVFWKIASFILENTDINIVQLFGDAFFISLGNLQTGDKFTASLNYLMGKLFHIMSNMAVAPTRYVEISKVEKCAYMGDDFVSRLPVPVAKMVYGIDLREYSLLVQDSVGVVYKPDQSFVLYPTPEHRDRAFTWISPEDEVLSMGCVMLKRHMVKLDKDCNFLHPDSRDFHCIGLWRQTNEIVSRFALDPANWAPYNSPWIKWFRKSFGLLVDIGCNRTAHNMIKNAVNAARIEHPNDWDLACSGIDQDVSIVEFMKKIGDIPLTLMSTIFDRPDSFKLVCSFFLMPLKAYDITPLDLNVPVSWVI